MSQFAAPGAVILLNGASSSGKSTLARGLQGTLDGPFWHISIDHLVIAKVLPMDRIDSGEFQWSGLREPFFDGFHRCVRAFSEAGNDLIVEHIVETEAWMNRLVDLLDGLDVYFVGLHCPVDELARRERARSDRKPGEAENDARTVHTFGEYDLEVDSTRPVDRNVAAIIDAWRIRHSPSAFERMREGS